MSRGRVALSGGLIERTREVLEVPLGAADLIEHAGIERHCPRYGRRVVPTVDLGGVVVGRQRVGLALLSRPVTLREVTRAPLCRSPRYSM